MTELIDWAKHNTRSTVFSWPLPEKCFGVFAFTGQRDHPFVGKRGRLRLIPHSRYNGLLQSDLERAGYDILASSPVHGVDSFAKTAVSQFVFLQGHPEYDANSLAHEYRRDMGRYLRGDLERAPSIPTGYFNFEAEAELSALERRAREGQRQLLLQELSTIDALGAAASGMARHGGVILSQLDRVNRFVDVSKAGRCVKTRAFASGSRGWAQDVEEMSTTRAP